MADWVDDILENRIKQRADEHIRFEKYKIAVSQTDRVRAVLENDIRSRVERFRKQHDNLEIGEHSGWLKIRTIKPPVSVVQLRFHAGQIEVEQCTQSSLESGISRVPGIVRIHGEFDGDPWFEYNGHRLNEIGELSRLLLQSLFQEAAQS